MFKNLNPDGPPPLLIFPHAIIPQKVKGIIPPVSRGGKGRKALSPLQLCWCFYFSWYDKRNSPEPKKKRTKVQRTGTKISVMISSGFTSRGSFGYTSRIGPEI